MRRPARGAAVAACMAAVGLLGCSADPPSPADPTPSESEAPMTEPVVAAGVAVEVEGNGSRLVVRNTGPAEVLVLDTAMQPQRGSDGVLTLTYVRPGDTATGDAPPTFETVAVPEGGQVVLEPPFALKPGDRLRYCLEVVDPAEAIGDDLGRVHDRDASVRPRLACSDPVTVR